MRADGIQGSKCGGNAHTGEFRHGAGVFPRDIWVPPARERPPARTGSAIEQYLIGGGGEYRGRDIPAPGNALGLVYDYGNTYLGTIQRREPGKGGYIVFST
jgi:hypothetical protein